MVVRIAVKAKMMGLSAVNSASKSRSLKPCGCSLSGWLHQIDDVHDADPQLGQMLAQNRDGGERLERRHVAGARHDDVGYRPCRCWPNARCRCLLRNARRRSSSATAAPVLAGDHDVHVWRLRRQ
jgi:hypothetical protein